MKRRLIIILSLLVAAIVGGSYVGDRMLKSKGHPGLKKFLHQWWVNYPASFAVEPEVVELKVDQADLDALENVVHAARDRGVIMREGNDYVPAEFTAGGNAFKVKVRIKGKMADHVKGDKWSFRVQARKDNGFKGMQRFSLQHPGTRNYLCDWFYHRLMKGEGIIALRYGFVRLHFNGEDLGIYAYEEHFGPELLANNDRLKGPLFRFDPGLFWQHRLNMIEKVRYNEPFAAYQAAELDAFGSGDMEKDTVQRRYFEEAVALMDAFRRGVLPAAQVFDADKIARRHAILDLVGGHHSMDWSDVKFYYDPLLKRIEPVAYESFSAFPIRSLAGSNRYVGGFKQSMDLHDAYFNDTVVFAAYVHHLERVSRPEFLDSAFTVLAPALDSASAMIYREFPYKELDRDIYRHNQMIIRRMLDVPKGFHAYAAPATDSLRLTIVPIEGLPIEVLGAVAADGRVLPMAKRTIVPCRPPGSVGTPMEARIPLDDRWRSSPPQKVELRYRVLGATTEKTLEVFPYAYLDSVSTPAFAPPSGYDVRTVAWLVVDEGARTIVVKPGAHIVSEDVYIPAGYSVRAVAPLRIDLVKGARIVSRSPMHWKGLEDSPITLLSSDQGGGGLLLVSTGGSSVFEHVRIEGFGPTASTVPSIVLQEAPSQWVRCALGEVQARDLMQVVRGAVTLTECRFTGGADQVKLAYTNATLEKVDLRGAADDALLVKGGAARISEAVVYAASGDALAVDEAATVTVERSTLEATKDAIEVSEGATLVVEGGRITSAKGSAIEVKQLHARHGPSTVTLKGAVVEANDPPKIGKGNKVTINGGAPMGSTVP